MSLSYERPRNAASPRNFTDLHSDTTALLCDVLQTGVELAAAARETSDPDVVESAQRAAQRLYETATSVLDREELDEGDEGRLRAEAERLRELLPSRQ
jgi:hypothetical protein